MYLRTSAFWGQSFVAELSRVSENTRQLRLRRVSFPTPKDDDDDDAEGEQQATKA